MIANRYGTLPQFPTFTPDTQGNQPKNHCGDTAKLEN